MDFKVGDVVYLIEDIETIGGVIFVKGDKLTIDHIVGASSCKCRREGDGAVILTSFKKISREKPFEECMNPPVDPSTEDGSPNYIHPNTTIDEYEVTHYDPVNHPSHYEAGKFECIEVMEEALGYDAVRDFCICNAFKYLYRHKRKNGYEDIKKAQWYINKYIDMTDKAKENGLEVI